MSESGWLPSETDLGLLFATAAEVAGATATSWQCTYLDVHNGSTRALTATVGLEWPDGSRTEETFGAGVGRHMAGALRMSDGQHEVGVWRFPHDPALPGLAAACDPQRMRGLVASMGLGDEPVALTVRAYRPTRRAVVEVRTSTTSLFVKVLRPAKVGELHELHRASEHALVPESLGWTDDGLLVLAGKPGRSLQELLLTGETALPDPELIVGLLDGLPAAFVSRKPRQGWAELARHYAESVASVLPDAGSQAHRIADAVDAVGIVPGRCVPVHGDFYESQLLVAGDRFSALLDIDTAHGGDGYDDPACLLGHLAVLAQLNPDQRGITRYLDRCLGVFERHWEPRVLRARVAAVVLSLATGPHRVRQAGWQNAIRERLALADRWNSGEQPLAA
ncbi:hypothetical protein ABZ639_16245 [Saccharomonospora sp. NPDC006951]